MTTHKMRLGCRALVLVMMSLAWCATAGGAEVEVTVPRWQPRDFTFSAPEAAAGDNPFRAQFSADVTGPGGAKLTVPGFYDGDGKWVVRVSPTAAGAWRIVTRSGVAALDEQQRAFNCIPNTSPNAHGALRVDRENPHHFVFEDGTRHFAMGYECDWLWALDVGQPQLKTIEPFLDKLVAHGFNFVILNTYAHDTSWRKGRSGDDDYGPPPMYPWAGTNEQPDHARFNLDFWRHYDRMMEAMHQRGIVAHVLIKVYNKQVKWPAKGSAEDDQFFRWVIARYAAYPNVTWDFAKEAQYEKDMEYKLGRLKFIRATDPYKRLLTNHDDRANYDKGAFDAYVDYRSDQQHKQWRASMLEHRKQRAWPVINTEFGYEHGPGGIKDKTYSHVQSPEEVARRGWEVYMAGGYGAYYYTHTAWDVLRPADTPPGYAYFKHLRAFFEQTRYWQMQPTEGVTTAGYCLADAGREYAVFLNSAEPFTLKAEGIKSPLKARWYRPLTGEWQDASAIESASAALTPPAEWAGGPVALHARAAD